MHHPVRERIVAVLGPRQGSGYLLAPALVLTAGHVVSGAETVRAVVPGGVGPVGCRVAWLRDDEECDAALLVAERSLVPEGVAAAFEPVEWAELSLGAWSGAQAIGFPDVQRSLQGELDTEQFVGTLKTGSQLMGGRYVLDSDHAAPQAVAGSPWAGMSGAAVFVSGYLVGVVCSDPAGWRHSRLSVLPGKTMLRHRVFVGECWAAGHRSRLRIVAHRPESETDKFEHALREYLVRKAAELTIVGLTLSDGDGETWPLDTAYLSLELTGGRRTDDFGAPAVSAPQRAEAALAGQKRVLLRGAAGSGKTTLLQWLATITARDELPPALSQLTGCLPLTLSLRALVREGSELPRPEDFLAAAARPLAGQPGACGWVTRRLAEGTLLLLIDGVDEVPEADRRRTLTWLKDLLAAYPSARYVVTTRPSAVREGWLADLGFTELELLPMSRADVAAFIDRWHTTAERHALPDELDRLRAFRESLRTAVVAKPDLGRLATNPLMCAMICALNRARRGYLPRGRMELYRAALELLLVRRDRERDIPLLPELDHAHQLALLQKIAYWLIRNGRSEIEWHKAVEIVGRALPAMPSVADADPARLLDHLVLRSGLLRRPTSETLDFIHRTFQDYLGAKAAVDDWDFDVLVEHAHDDQWEDVLRMAVGHAVPRARAELFRLLLARAEREPRRRHRLHLVAAACLEHATEVDPEVRAQVEGAARELIPPRDVDSAKELAAAGRVVLDLLPGPEGLPDEVAHAVVVAATTVGGDQAIPLLARYATHDYLNIRSQLSWSWDKFDTQRYADEVIAELAYEEADSGLRFAVKSREHMKALARLGGRPLVECFTPPSADVLDELFTPVLQDASFACAGIVDLGILREFRPLRGVRVQLADQVRGLGKMPMDRLRLLHLELEHCPCDLAAVSDMAELRNLFLGWSAGHWSAPGRLVLPPGLRRLGLGERAADLLRARTHDLPDLETLAYDRTDFQTRHLALHTLPRLRGLGIRDEAPTSWAGARPVPGVTKLSLIRPVGLDGLARLPEVFPAVEELFISTHKSLGEPLDLAPLIDHGALTTVRIHHSGPVLNAEALQPRCEVTVKPATINVRP
ncbi:serine protease [Streptomyces orinoci]|uniref:NACHT domain-containing protein n=1 Tax=Streptomyces orinoci TaxID=67339 RepID=A0ABV3JXX8_STRON|nr:serine protease [Streptomyces orinoci]